MRAIRPLLRMLVLGAALLVGAARGEIAVYAPDGMPTGKTITAEQFRQQLDGAFPPGVWVSPLENGHYEVVSARWMRRSFLPALKRQMEEIRRQGIPADDSAGNCGGLALVCRLMLNLAAMNAHARAPAAATVIVFQEHPFGGLDATKENHCVAFALTDEGPWIIEAQSGAFVPLAGYPNRDSIKLVSVH